MAENPTHSLLSRLIAEVFGTLMLVIGVIGAALFISAKTGPLGVALAVGLAVLTAAYAVGHISGGHFNPAVSIGAAAAGRLPWADVLPYIAAQIVGGVLATFLLWLISALSGGKFTADFGAVSNGFDAHSPSGFGIGAAILTEIVVTALFLWIILGVTASGSPAAGFAPLAIGLALTLFHLIAIPVDNASLNPARSIATAVFGGSAALGQLWVFIVAPIVGALIAGLTWKPLFGRK
ncbi:aquaporin [Lysinimonas soli]|uniref:Aquaporin n=1 Tax=Lysinimonas soli TaxID=1074233 RepID=A0ABW0NWY3_9MICO